MGACAITLNIERDDFRQQHLFSFIGFGAETWLLWLGFEVDCAYVCFFYSLVTKAGEAPTALSSNCSRELSKAKARLVTFHSKQKLLLKMRSVIESATAANTTVNAAGCLPERTKIELMCIHTVATPLTKRVCKTAPAPERKSGLSTLISLLLGPGK